MQKSKEINMLFVGQDLLKVKLLVDIEMNEANTAMKRYAIYHKKYEKESMEWWNNLSDQAKEHVYGDLVKTYGSYEKYVKHETEKRIKSYQERIDSIKPLFEKLQALNMS